MKFLIQASMTCFEAPSINCSQNLQAKKLVEHSCDQLNGNLKFGWKSIKRRNNKAELPSTRHFLNAREKQNFMGGNLAMEHPNPRSHSLCRFHQELQPADSLLLPACCAASQPCMWHTGLE